MKCRLGLRNVEVVCGYKPQKGIRHRVLMIPYESVDRAHSVVNYNRACVDLRLLYGKRGYVIELQDYFKVSGVMKYNGTGYVQEVTMRLDKRHGAGTKIMGVGAVGAMSAGTWVMVIETRDGDFEVLGFDAGLVVTAATMDYNSSGVLVTLGTSAGLTERCLTMEWLSADDKSRRFDEGIEERHKWRIFDGTFDETFE